MTEKKPPIGRCVALFASIYFALLWLIGYSLMALGRKSGTSANIMVILLTVTLVSVWFARRQKRPFSTLEYWIVVLGCVTFDVLLQISVTWYLVGSSAFVGKWGDLILILLGHAGVIALGFSSRVVGRYVPATA